MARNDGRAQRSHNITFEAPPAGTQGRVLILQTRLRVGQRLQDVVQPFGKSLLALATRVQNENGGQVPFAVTQGVGNFVTSKHGHLVQARLLVPPRFDAFHVRSCSG